MCASGVVGLAPKWGRLDPKWDKSGTFSDQIPVHLAHRAKCTEIWSEKVPDLFNLGSNLTHFGAKPTIPAVHPGDSGTRYQTVNYRYCQSFSAYQAVRLYVSKVADTVSDCYPLCWRLYWFTKCFNILSHIVKYFRNAIYYVIIYLCTCKYK